MDATELKPGQAVRLEKWSRLRGVLMQDGKPVVGENIDLRWLDNFSPDRPYLNLHGTVTDDNGAFEIEKVPAGKISIALRDTTGGGGAWTSRRLKLFEAPAGEELDLGTLNKKDAELADRRR